MAEPIVSGKKCPFCAKMIKLEAEACNFCGYNFKTKTQDPAFKEQSAKKENDKGKGASKVMSAIKTIVLVVGLFIGLTLLIRAMTSKVMGTIHLGAQKPKQTAAKTTASPVKPQEKKSMPMPDLLKKVLPDEKMRLQAQKEQKQQSAVFVEGIFYDPKGKKFASLNGSIVAEGESLGTVKVHRVNEDTLELLVNGSLKIVRVGESVPFSSK